MSAFSFSRILAPGNQVETPPGVERITGHKPVTYAVADRIYMHFSNVDTASESQRLLATMAETIPEVSAGIWGGELVLNVPKAAFRKNLLTTQPS